MDAAKRKRCLELVAKIPESGLDETLETLQELIEHYQELDETLANPVEWPEPVTVTAKIAKVVKL